MNGVPNNITKKKKENVKPRKDGNKEFTRTAHKLQKKPIVRTTLHWEIITTAKLPINQLYYEIQSTDDLFS